MKRRMLAVLMAAAMLCAASLPAAAAEEVDGLPEEVETPLSPMPGEPVGELATVLEAVPQTSGVYPSLTVKTEDYDKLVLHFGAGTLLMDTQTGEMARESDIQKGDQVYIYRDEYVNETYPVQAGLRAVLVNLDGQHAPASLLTAEAVTRNADGSLTVQAQNGGMLVTLPADVETKPLGTKDLVSLDDIHMGTRFFAWYDMVALSYPGQATAEKAVIPRQQIDSTFSITVQSDMMIMDGGRVENGVAMVPVRAVAEALGYEVKWNGSLRRVTIKKSGATAALLQLGQDRYALGDGGDGISLGAAAYESGGTTWVPAELFSRMGETVELTGGVLHIGRLCGLPLAPEE